MGVWPFRSKTLRVPYIPQMESVECGAACLSMVLAAHGRHVALVDMRLACGVSRDGANALNVLRAAREQGLETEAVKVEVEFLHDLPLPAVLHWDFNHFLVLERLTRQGAVLVDPALGRRQATWEELNRHFTGVALVFAPSEEFEKLARRRPSLKRYRSLLEGARSHLIQVLGASFMLQMVGLIFPVSNQLLLDRVIAPKQEPWLWGLAFGLGMATAGKILLSLVRSWVIQGLQTRLDFDLMGNFLKHLMHLPLSFFLQRTPGDLLQRVQTNTQLRALFTSNSVSALLDSFLLLGYAALMLAYQPVLGSIVLGFGALRVGVLWAQMDRNQQYMAAEMAAGGREGGALVEAFSSLETLKASAAEAHMTRRWTDRMVERINASLGRRYLDLFAGQANVLLQGFAGAAVLWVGGYLVIHERMTVGVYASFIALQGLFMGPLESLLGAATQLQLVGNHLARLDDVLDTPVEPTGTEAPGRLEGALSIQGVSFSYSPGSPAILKNISLEVRAGEKVALVGPTGAGKSTLARLMLGMHIPDEGRILFDGRDLASMDLQLLRKQMGVVLQDTFLFDDSVRANLSLNDPDLPESRLVWAAKMACIWDVIENLPQGLDSRVGENGNLLSGGQRQRLSLARALAHDPAVLLLDEATSSLDLETEERLHANLAGLGCTRVLIAHRLATVMDADRIFVVENGAIVQTGTYKQLADQPGLFRTLVGAMEKAHG